MNTLTVPAGTHKNIADDCHHCHQPLDRTQPANILLQKFGDTHLWWHETCYHTVHPNQHPPHIQQQQDTTE